MTVVTVILRALDRVRERVRERAIKYPIVRETSESPVLVSS